MNVTLSIPESVLARARQRAARQSTTVNNLIRNFLEDYSKADEKNKIAQEALDFFKTLSPTIPKDVRITRDEMEER